MIAQEGGHHVFAQLALKQLDDVAQAFALLFHIVSQDLGDVAAALRHWEGEKAVHAAGVIIVDGVQAVPTFAHDKAVGADGLGRAVQPAQEGNVLFLIAGIVACHRVQAEAVHTHFQPEAHDLFDFRAHLRVIQIQVRHGGYKAGFKVRAVRQRVVARFGGIGEVVIRAVGRVGAGPGSLEPRVLAGGVVDHQIKDYFDARLVRGFQKRLEILHGAVLRIDRPVVRHIVFVIAG